RARGGRAAGVAQRAHAGGRPVRARRVRPRDRGGRGARHRPARADEPRAVTADAGARTAPGQTSRRFRGAGAAGTIPAAMPTDPPPLLARLPAQYFTRLLAAAARARAEPGPRFIDLGRGNPDIPPPRHALDALTAAAGETATPIVHGYPPFRGHASL